VNVGEVEGDLGVPGTGNLEHLDTIVEALLQVLD
jgi:hypothetical protein